MRSIITISRQFGSCGHDIGKLVAEKFGIPFYGKEIITLAAKERGYAPEVFEKADEVATNSFLYAISTGAFMMNNIYSTSHVMPLNDQLYIAQSNVIKDLAAQGPCVIIGRCADSILGNLPETVSVFIYADMDYRIKNTMEKDGLSENEARDTIIKNDKKRANYYNYYSDKKWNDMESHDLLINSAKVGTEGAAKIIYDFVLEREKFKFGK
ncbi:MAG: cytidylate kinase-like family protein [Clostridia bacterium]|nr:cytidylate kinase-like family protein [Clostridia bacterium]